MSALASLTSPTIRAVASRRFEAARRLAQASGARRSLHGHGFVASVVATVGAGLASYAGGEVAALQARVDEVVAVLDYQLLNDHLEEPSDLCLAQWLLPRLGGAEIERVGLQSTPDQGVDLDRHGRAQVWRRYRFQAAHQLPHVAPGHKCGRMHGHGFAVLLHADALAGAGDRAVDHSRLDALWAPLQRQLDHRCLNDIAGLENPTSEMLASWIRRRLLEELPALRSVGVYETTSCGASFDGEHFRIWKDFSFDSAVRLRHAPPGDSQHGLHGHSYTLRLVIGAPLDAAMGWTIDFGDVKQIFEPIVEGLDHRPLHELPGIDDASTTALAAALFAQAQRELPALVGLELYESDGCGAVVGVDSGFPPLPV